MAGVGKKILYGTGAAATAMVAGASLPVVAGAGAVVGSQAYNIQGGSKELVRGATSVLRKTKDGIVDLAKRGFFEIGWATVGTREGYAKGSEDVNTLLGNNLPTKVRLQPESFSFNQSIPAKSAKALYIPMKDILLAFGSEMQKQDMPGVMMRMDRKGNLFFGQQGKEYPLQRLGEKTQEKIRQSLSVAVMQVHKRVIATVILFDKLKKSKRDPLYQYTTADGIVKSIKLADLADVLVGNKKHTDTELIKKKLQTDIPDFATTFTDEAYIQSLESVHSAYPSGIKRWHYKGQKTGTAPEFAMTKSQGQRDFQQQQITPDTAVAPTVAAGISSVTNIQQQPVLSSFDTLLSGVGLPSMTDIASQDLSVIQQALQTLDNFRKRQVSLDTSMVLQLAAYETQLQNRQKDLQSQSTTSP